MPNLTFGLRRRKGFSLLASFDNPCKRVTRRFKRVAAGRHFQKPLLAHANKGQVTAAETETTQTTDYALAQKAASGDMQSFEQLYQRHNRRVYSLCLRMTQNVSEAEDLAQEVFIQLFRKIGSFRGESAFTTWLHRLTVNQVLMHFRKRSVRDEKTTEEGETPEQIVKGTENPNSMPVVDRIALDKAIAQLPPGYRTVFVLHDVEGHEHEEIARMLGCSVGTSKSQLHKARMKLRGLLRQQNEPK
jgi:RNA polymerase sigma-70 factor (ECF subfamily)